ALAQRPWLKLSGAIRTRDARERGERSQNLKPNRAPALVVPMFWRPKSAFEITRERANLRLGGPEFDTAVMDGTPKKARMVAASAGWRRLTRRGGDANFRQ